MERSETDIYVRPDGSVVLNMPPPDLVGMVPVRSRGRSLARRHTPRDLVRITAQRPAIRRLYESCGFCPLECGWNRVRRPHPICGGPRPTLAHAGISSAEEHGLRGRSGSGIIMLGSCPLSCPDCIDRDKMARAKPTTVRKLFEEAWRLRDDGVATLQVANATCHTPLVRALLESLKKGNYDIPLAIKSSGFEKIETIRAFSPFVDIWVPDLKFGPQSKTAVIAGAPEYFEIAKAAIDEMLSLVGPTVSGRNGIMRKGVLVRHVDSGLPRRERYSVDRFLASLPDGVVVSRMPFVSLPALPPSRIPAIARRRRAAALQDAPEKGPAGPER